MGEVFAPWKLANPTKQGSPNLVPPAVEPVVTHLPVHTAVALFILQLVLTYPEDTI